MSGRRVGDAIKSLVNARGLQLESGRVLYESLLVPVLMYGSNTMNDMEGEGDLGLGLPSMKRMYKVRNAQIREL